METIGQRIKTLRQKNNLTQEEFGQLFGIVKSTVSLYESGKSTPNDEIKKAICKYFGVTMDYLLGLSNDSNISVGTELKAMIESISLELGQPFSVLLDIYTNKKIPTALNRENLLHFFKFFLDKENLKQDNSSTNIEIEKTIADALSGTNLLDTNGKLTEEGMNIIAEFIRNNKDMIQAKAESLGIEHNK